MSDKPETVTIQPFASRGVPFVSDDGRVSMEPMQLFAGDEPGEVYLRIGNSMYWFYPDDKGRGFGVYDGPEFAVSGKVEFSQSCIEVFEEEGVAGDESDLWTALLQRSIENKGEMPDTTYFEMGTPGFKKERA